MRRTLVHNAPWRNSLGFEYHENALKPIESCCSCSAQDGRSRPLKLEPLPPHQGYGVLLCSPFQVAAAELVRQRTQLRMLGPARY